MFDREQRQRQHRDDPLERPPERKQAAAPVVTTMPRLPAGSPNVVLRRSATSRIRPAAWSGPVAEPTAASTSTPRPFRRVSASSAGVVQRAKTNQTASKKSGQPGKASKSPKGGVAKKPRAKASKAATTRAIASAQNEEEWDFATGHTGSGRWTEDVTVRAPQSFADERTRQVLRHLATAVYHYAKSKVDAEQEVQAMYVNERLFVSSNLPSSMAALRNLTAAQLTDIFLSTTNISTSDVRGVRSAQKLKALVQGTRIDEIPFEDEAEFEQVATVAGVISGVVEDPTRYVSYCKVDQAHRYVEGDEHQFKLVVVEGLRPVHAEQNLILAYCNSGSTAQALIYGKKRPCTGCYLTFRYARDVLGKAGLVFSSNPGGYWTPAVQGLWQLISTKDMKLEEIDRFVTRTLPKMTYRSARAGTAKKDARKRRTHTKDEETGYDTESDTEDM